MSRSSWKHPIVNTENFKDLKKNLKITARNEVIPSNLVGLKVNIYNGSRYISTFIEDNKVGYKFGEFAFSRKLCVHKKKSKK
jgi:small subunit ribosomal protein S19